MSLPVVTIIESSSPVELLVHLATVLLPSQDKKRKCPKQPPQHCPICDVKIKRRSNLIRHQRTHGATPEKRFRCEECEKSFAEKHHLDSHLRVHRGLKPYCCPHCQRCFADRSNCQRHIAAIHRSRKRPTKKPMPDSVDDMQSHSSPE